MRLIMLLSTLLFFASGCRRSVHRPTHTHLPQICAAWAEPHSPEYCLKNSHLEPTLFQTYDADHIEENQLPETVTFRKDPTKSVPRQELIAKLEKAIQKLQNTDKKIKKLDDFIILKQRDFNYRKQTGLMVLKYKDYPFVVKLFIEKPETMTKPFGKGIEECAFFIMGGGMNRFLAGFTRIKNRDYIIGKIKSNRYWSAILDVPRKWYWVPDNVRYIAITSKYLGTQDYHLEVPQMYAIFCDAIDAERTLSLLNREDRFLAIYATEYLGLCIDPHINNFIVEKDTQKVIIIDTEHFPTMVGIKEPFRINDFVTYYIRLFGKFMKKKLTLDKKTRRELQEHPKPLLFPYE